MSDSNKKEKQQLTKTIADTQRDILEYRARVKDTGKQIDNYVTSLPEYSLVEEAQEALSIAKKKLNARLAGDGQYQDMMDSKDKNSKEINDLRDVMSVHLVRYKDLTGADQVELGGHIAAQIVIVGRLGKVGLYQTTIDDMLEAGDL